MGNPDYALSDDGKTAFIDGVELSVADLEAADRVSQKSLFDVGHALDYFHILQNYTIETAFTDELVGRDLTGLSVRAYVANYEDSYWSMSTQLKTFTRSDDGLTPVASDGIAELLKAIEEAETDADLDRVDDLYKKLDDGSDMDFFYLNFDAIFSVEVLTPREGAE